MKLITYHMKNSTRNSCALDHDLCWSAWNSLRMTDWCWHDYSPFATDSDNLHEDLAELTCSISIKQKLVEELEQAQKQVLAVRHQYEEKVRQLQMRIRATEEERDQVLSSINNVASESNEKVKKVKDEFEKKLITLQRDLKKAEQAKRDYSRMQKQSSYHEKQLKTLQHELQEMKRTKVWNFLKKFSILGMEEITHNLKGGLMIKDVSSCIWTDILYEFPYN